MNPLLPLGFLRICQTGFPAAHAAGCQLGSPRGIRRGLPFQPWLLPAMSRAHRDVEGLPAAIGVLTMTASVSLGVPRIRQGTKDFLCMNSVYTPTAVREALNPLYTRESGGSGDSHRSRSPARKRGSWDNPWPSSPRARILKGYVWATSTCLCPSVPVSVSHKQTVGTLTTGIGPS